MGNEFAITTQHCWIVGHAMVPAGHSQMPHDTTRASCKHHTCSSIHNGLHIRISHSKLIGQCQACGQDGQPRPILLHTPGREWHLCAQCQPVSVALALQTSEPSESRRQRRSHGPGTDAKAPSPSGDAVAQGRGPLLAAVLKNARGRRPPPRSSTEHEPWLCCINAPKTTRNNAHLRRPLCHCCLSLFPNQK